MRKTLFTIAALVWFAFSCAAQTNSDWNPQWDPDYAPITQQSMVSTIQRNSQNAAVLVKMIQKAMAFKYGDVAYETLDKMRQQHPNSPDTLAAFCWAYELQLGNAYMKGGDYHTRTAKEDRVFKDTLARAKKLAPDHWLVNFVSGYRAYAKGVEDFDKALPLLGVLRDWRPTISMCALTVGHSTGLLPTLRQ